MKLWFFALTVVLSAQAVPLSFSGTDLRNGRAVNWIVQTRPGVVVFLSPTCPCSRSHEAALTELAKQHPGVDFLGVVSGDAPESAAHFRAGALPFPVIAEKNHEWADALGALNTPHAFVIHHGEVVYRGGVDDSRQADRAKRHYLRDALTDIEAGRAVANAETRAVGCAIRR